MNAAELKARLDCGKPRCACARPNGNTHCPSHDDIDPSLTVSAGDKVAVVVNCHAGCSQEQVIDALRARGLWNDATPQPRGRSDAIRYQAYRASDGAAVAQHVRIDQPNAKKRMWWEPTGTKTTDLELYGIRELPSDGLVVVTEGEKARDALKGRDVPAVGTVTGAATIPCDAALRPLLNHPLALWPDADDEGRKHMRALASRLRDLGHQDVRFIRWTDAPGQGADAADFSGDDGALRALIESAAGATPVNGIALTPIDWGDFWSRDHKDEDWLCEPLIPRQRSVATFSPAKVGKSLLAIDVAAHLATGQRVFDQPAGDPIEVSYFDMEMTETDIFERLVDLGYGPEADLSHFHYYLLPDLPPLDTPEGADVLMATVTRDKAALVIIDTTGRVVEGKENDADTMRAYYRHTGRQLKAAGITVWRLDHAGKDPSRGQRGTSAKDEDVDLVWELTAREGNTVRLRATHRRQKWVPEQLDLVRLEEPLRHELAAETTWPKGTEDVAAVLDQLAVPLDATTRTAVEALRAANNSKRRAVVVAALKWRKHVPVLVGTTSGTTISETSGNHGGNRDAVRFGNHYRNHTEPLNEGIREPGSPLIGEPVPSPLSDPCPSCGEVAWFKRAAGGIACGVCTPPVRSVR